MAEINIKINGRHFGIACDDGQEQRVMDLAAYVDARLKEISSGGGGTNESHLLVLTSLVMADELFELKDSAANYNREPLNGLQITEDDEQAIIDAIERMAHRIDTIAGNLQRF